MLPVPVVGAGPGIAEPGQPEQLYPADRVVIVI
jgi:hypothetical protein